MRSARVRCGGRLRRWIDPAPRITVRRGVELRTLRAVVGYSLVTP